MLLSLRKSDEDLEEAGLFSKTRVYDTTRNSFSCFVTCCFCFMLLCMDVYKQANAWQRSYVRSPAIKKKKPRGGRRRKPVVGGEEGGGRQQRRRLFFLSSEAAERSGHGKAGEWENGAESSGIAPRVELPKPAVSLPALRHVRFTTHRGEVRLAPLLHHAFKKKRK